MAINYGDILLNEEMSIYATPDGDLATGDNREHQIGAIVNADEGVFRKNPTMAARLSRFLDAPVDSRSVVSNVTQAVALDGWRVDEMTVTGSDGSVDVTISKAEKTTDNTEDLV